MTNNERHRLENAILAYGRAKSETSFAQAGGSEAQVEIARCHEADAWEAVQRTLDAFEAPTPPTHPMVPPQHRSEEGHPYDRLGGWR